MRKVAVGTAAAVLLGGAEAFAPQAGGLPRARPPACEARAVPAQRAASGRRTTSAPALRMGIGDMFKDAFSNNPNIPTATATGPGSPGFSAPKPQQSRRSKGTETLEQEPEPAPAPAPPAPAAEWQQATDPATGNPYWYNAATGESSWTPPAAAPPPPAPVAVAAPPPQAQAADENTVIQLPKAAAQEDDDNGPTGPSPERQLINLNRFLVNGLIDQEEYDEQAAAIKALMPKGPVLDTEALQRPFTKTTVKWGALIDTKIPKGWVENKHYDRQAKLAPGSLVGINRSDGSIRFGQVVKKTGLFYEDYWQVVVSMKDDGKPGATREEDGVMLMRPTELGLSPVLEAMPKIEVQEEDIESLLNSGKKDKGFFGNMFGEAVYEGGSAPTEAPPVTKAPAPAKAVVPAGIIPGSAPAPPKAVVPEGIMSAAPPTAAPPAATPPSAATPPTAAAVGGTPETETKQSEWI